MPSPILGWPAAVKFGILPENTAIQKVLRKKSYVYRTEIRLLHDFCRRDEGIPPYRFSTDSGIELISIYIRSKR